MTCLYKNFLDILCLKVYVTSLLGNQFAFVNWNKNLENKLYAVVQWEKHSWQIVSVLIGSFILICSK